MPLYTRSEMLSRAMRLAYRDAVSAVAMPDSGIRDPFTYSEDLDEIVAELERTTGGGYLFYSLDVNAGQARYCPSPIFEIDGASLILSNGRGTIPLGIVKPGEFKYTVPGYLINSATGDPSTLVIEGDSDYLLYPTPNFTSAAGLVVRGRGFSDPTAWAGGDGKCPLPSKKQDCVIHQLAARITPTPAIEQREWAQYLYYKGLLGAEEADITDDSRNRSMGGWGGTFGIGPAYDIYANPLNL